MVFWLAYVFRRVVFFSRWEFSSSSPPLAPAPPPCHLLLALPPPPRTLVSLPSASPPRLGRLHPVVKISHKIRRRGGRRHLGKVKPLRRDCPISPEDRLSAQILWQAERVNPHLRFKVQSCCSAEFSLNSYLLFLVVSEVSPWVAACSLLLPHLGTVCIYLSTLLYVWFKNKQTV